MSFMYPKKKNPDDIKKKALEKSLIFPGWGQMYEKQYLKGIIFMSSEIFCILQVIINNNKANNYYSKYKLAINTEETKKFRSKTEKYDKIRNIYILTGALIWIANMIEIYFYTKKKYKKGVSFYIKQDEGNKIYFGINICF